MKIRALILILSCVLLTACSSAEQFDYPDIKDDFCGVHINFQFCKCAFHGDFCEAVGMDRSGAKAHVNAAYDKWVDGLLADWLTACESSGGIPGDDDCTRCQEGSVAKNGQCVDMSETLDDDLDSEDKPSFKADGPLTDDCKIIDDQFSRDWRKYSDIDEVIPYNERSFEAKKSVDAYDQMITKMVRAFELERDIEIEQQMQDELLVYKQALVQDLKTNLLKAFWRLSWVTYSTAKAGSGLGQSYSKILTNGASVATIGSGLKVVQGTIPKDSSLVIDKSTLGGKAASVGASTAIKAVETLGDPTKVATELFKSSSKAAMPSADISAEEVEILRQQHVENGLIDQVIAESQGKIQSWQTELSTIGQEINSLQQEISSWEAKEKERVKVSLESSCEDLKAQYEDS